MALRKASPFTFRASGVCDAVDGSNAPSGAMAQLANLIPSPSTRGQFVPRPAATQITNFAGFTTPAQVEALLVIGARAFGLIASARFTGKSEPFCYDLTAGAFIALGNVTAANCPTTQPAVGDWTPPQLAMVGQRIVITHPGYDGVNTFVGWIDLRSFSFATTGATHSSTTVDGLASTLGIMVGDAVSGAGIPANTYVTAVPSSSSVTLSNAATATAAGVALTFSSGTLAAPTYGAGQTAGQPLPAAPTGVSQFNGRAYYVLGNKLALSDSLIPQQISNATQFLTLGDTTAITAVGGLPLANQVVGGVLQALIAFKAGIYYQITGDPATSDLKVQAVPGSVGTQAPNSLCATPQGLTFAAADGLRIVGLDSKCSDPLGSDGSGVSVPFLYANTPTRIAAAYLQGVLRISVSNGYKDGQPTEEYWFDFVQKCWTGPHSFPAALIQGYFGAANSFVLAAVGLNGKLFQSSTQPSSASTYTENGAALAFNWTTSLLPDNEQGAANQVVTSALGLSLPSGQAVTVAVYDEQNVSLDTVTLTSPATTGSAWGAGFVWGSGVWGGAVVSYQQYTLPWHTALVFKQARVQVSGTSVGNFAIGNFYAKVQPTGYVGAHP